MGADRCLLLGEERIFSRASGHHVAFALNIRVLPVFMVGHACTNSKLRNADYLDCERCRP